MNPTDRRRPAWGTDATDQTADDSRGPSPNTSAPSAFQYWHNETGADHTQYNTQQLPPVLEPHIDSSGPPLPWRGGATNAPSQHRDFDLDAQYQSASTGTQSWSAGQAHSSFQGPAGFGAGHTNTRWEQSQPEQTYHPNEPIIQPRLAGALTEHLPFTSQQSDLPPTGPFGPHDGVPVEDGLSVWGSPDFWSTTVYSDTAHAVAGPSGSHLGGTDTARDDELGDSGALSAPERGEARVVCDQCHIASKYGGSKYGECDRTMPKCRPCRRLGIPCSYPQGAKATNWRLSWDSRLWYVI